MARRKLRDRGLRPNLPALRLLVETFRRIPPDLLGPPGPRPFLPYTMGVERIDRLIACVYSEQPLTHEQIRGLANQEVHDFWVWLAVCLAVPIDLLKTVNSGRRGHTRLVHKGTGRTGLSAIEDATGISRRSWMRLADRVRVACAQSEASAEDRRSIAPGASSAAEFGGVAVALFQMRRWLELAEGQADGRVARRRRANLKKLDRKGPSSATYRASLAPPVFRSKLRLSTVRPNKAHQSISDLAQNCHDAILRKQG